MTLIFIWLEKSIHFIYVILIIVFCTICNSLFASLCAGRIDEILTQPKKEKVVIVDPYSSGFNLAEGFYEKGYEVIHVKTMAEVSPIFGNPRTSRPEMFSKFIDVGERSKADVAEEIKNLNPKIIIAGMESGVSYADELAAKIGTSYSNGIHLSEARRNKYLMGETIREKSIDAVRQTLASSSQQALKWIEDSSLSYPVFVKPVKAGGTFGVRKCFNSQDVEKAFNEVVGKKDLYNNITDDRLLVQEFLEGPEYAVNIVGRDGKYVVTDIWQYTKIYIPGHGDIYDVDRMIKYEGETQSILINYAMKVLDALEIKNGPSHMEIKMVPNRGPVLVEVGARAAGAGMPKYSQIVLPPETNQLALTIESATDPEKFLERAARQEGYKLNSSVYIVALNSQKEGQKLNRNLADEKIRTLLSFKEITLNYGDGANVSRTIDEETKIGQVVLSNSNLEQLENDYKQIRKWENEIFFR